jgi:hypothetical protein
MGSRLRLINHSSRSRPLSLLFLLPAPPSKSIQPITIFHFRISIYLDTARHEPLFHLAALAPFIQPRHEVRIFSQVANRIVQSTFRALSHSAGKRTVASPHSSRFLIGVGVRLLDNSFDRVRKDRKTGRVARGGFSRDLEGKGMVALRDEMSGCVVNLSNTRVHISVQTA